METQKPKWTVSLSNGETLYEGKNEYEHSEGEPTPWRRLLNYIEEEELSITSLALYNDKQRWNLPSAGNNPNFRPFQEAGEPEEYKLRRMKGFDFPSGNETQEFIIIKADYGDYELQTWVSEDGQTSWSLVV